MEDLREKPKLFQELKDDSIKLPDDTLEDLESKAKIYDINPNTNYQIIKFLLEIENKNEKDINKILFFYFNKIQTLCLNDRKDIIKKINQDNNKIIKEKIKKWIELNEKSFIESYFIIIKKLKNIYQEYNNDGKELNITELEQLFKIKFYVDNIKINNPLIYGCNELKYAGLINNIYQHLFNQRNNEGLKINEKQSKENKFVGYENYPKDITMKKKIDYKKETKDKENIIIDPPEEEINDIDIAIKLDFMSKYLEKLNDQEFNEFFNLKQKFKSDDKYNFNLDYEVKPNIDSLFFHLLYFDLIICLYSFHGNSNYIHSYEENFFEKKVKKLSFLQKLQKKGFIFSDDNSKKIIFKKKDDVKSQLYRIYYKDNKHCYFEFNPYDYALSKIENDFNHINYDFEILKEKFNEPKYFSLYRFYKQSLIFKNDNITELFKENIKNMLSSNTAKELYYQYINYKEFQFPYKAQNKDKFFKQTFDIILYFPIPFKDIGGFTYKNFGIVAINNIYAIEKKNFLNPNTSFFYRICQLSFYKIIYVHEIISHYSSVIIHANKNETELATPENTFIEYCPMDLYIDLYSNYDGGERGESLLLGNKIKYIYLKGAIFLLNKISWEMGLNEFKKNFIKENDPKIHDSLNIIEESKENEFIKYYKDNDEKFKKETSFTFSKQNALFCFRDATEEDDKDIIFEDCIMFWDRISHKGMMTFKKSPLKILIEN